MTTLNVVPLGTSKIRDVPAMLEKLAADIRASRHGDVCTAAVVASGIEGGLAVFGFGVLEHSLTAVGLLHAGAHHLLNGGAVE